MIYTGDRIPLTVTPDTPFSKLFVAIGSENKRDLYQQFSFPEQEGFDPLTTLDSKSYTAVLSESATIAAKSGLAVVEVKIVADDGTSMSGESDTIEIKEGYLKNAR